MNHDDATLLFDRLGADVPDHAPPAGVLIAGGRVRRRRRTTRAVLGSMLAVVLVAGGTGVAVAVTASQPDVSGELVTPPPPAPPVSPSSREVGVGRAVLDVPSGWTTEPETCQGPDGDSVVFQASPPVRCASLLSRDRQQPGLYVTRFGTDHELLTAAPTIGGEAVLQSPAGCQVDGCTQIVAVPSQDVTFYLWRPRSQDVAGSLRQIRRIRDSLYLLPQGQVAVPLVAGDTLTAAGRSMQSAGLVLDDRAQVSPDVIVTATEPEVGSVVASGSTVTPVLKVPATLVTSSEQIEGEWNAVELDGRDVPASAVPGLPTLELTPEQYGQPASFVVSNGGCDSDRGRWSVGVDGTFTTSDVVRFVGKCVESPGPLFREGRVLEAATSAKLDARGRLILLQGSRQTAVFASVATGAHGFPATDTEQVLGKWTPLSIDGRDIDTQAAAGTLRLVQDLDQLRYDVSDGCNSRSGSWTLDPETGSFTTAEDTSAIAECTVDSQLIGHPAAFKRATSVRVNQQDQMFLLDDAGTVLAAYQRYARPPPPPVLHGAPVASIDELVGRWTPVMVLDQQPVSPLLHKADGVLSIVDRGSRGQYAMNDACDAFEGYFDLTSPGVWVTTLNRFTKGAHCTPVAKLTRAHVAVRDAVQVRLERDHLFFYAADGTQLARFVRYSG